MAEPVLNDKSGLSWPHVEGWTSAGAAWCHGAVGIGSFFLHATELGVMVGAADLTARAARTTARESRSQARSSATASPATSSSCSTCTCRPGTGPTAEARSLARLLEAFSHEKDGVLVWPSDLLDTFSLDYMTGYAGVAVCLLRLGNPEGLPHQLSRSGFQRRSPTGSRGAQGK